MPPEARQNIHTLFDGHDQVQRELILTETGYEAVTESTNAVIASALRGHVQQMQERLDSGLAARRWDPAFAEYRAHYNDIHIMIEPTDQGVKVVARGETPEAIRVAQNHARVINEFVDEGWSAHGETHAAVLTSESGDNDKNTGRGGRRHRHGQAERSCSSTCGDGCCRKQATSSTEENPS
jgi:hypothetical protein